MFVNDKIHYENVLPFYSLRFINMNKNTTFVIFHSWAQLIKMVPMASDILIQKRFTSLLKQAFSILNTGNSPLISHDHYSNTNL